MVNIEIPKHYTASPSSYSGTPHLTINRDATLDLDSSTAFEGPEKLLEVWFSSSADTLPTTVPAAGLKAVPPETWTDMLDLVNCKVLSIIESDNVDAYLLSESSMFVFPHKLVLKTCGTTTLLRGLPRMLEIAALSAGFPGVEADPPKGIPAAATPYRVFYSRKNFLFPTKQHGPHRSWRDEVRFLDRMFLGGSAYMIGKMNGEHWYLYITGPDTRMTPPGTPNSDKGMFLGTETKFLSPPQRMAPSLSSDEAQDETLEILMTDLDEQNARQFYLEDASAVAKGQHSQKFPQRTKLDDVKEKLKGNLGTIEEENGSPTSTYINGRETYDDFDVFEQTSSDHSGNSSDDEELTLPEELTTEGHALGTVVSDSCGLSDIYPTSKYPEAKIDAYMFTPCGFSANGVVPSPEGQKSGHYFTVHVTPEPNCSYASFETNVPASQTGRETADIVDQVVGIFKPGRFSVTVFEAKPEDSANGTFGFGPAARSSRRMEHIEGYKRIDRIVHDLDGYDLVFRYYERLDWKGGAPRIGEVGI